jgi:hypothetical protein
MSKLNSLIKTHIHRKLAKEIRSKLVATFTVQSMFNKKTLPCHLFNSSLGFGTTYQFLTSLNFLKCKTILSNWLYHLKHVLLNGQLCIEAHTVQKMNISYHTFHCCTFIWHREAHYTSLSVS